MKRFKLFAFIIAAALLLTPASAMARTNFSFSLNLFDCLPLFVPPPVVVAPPVVYYHPCPPPMPYYPRPYVREYHHYYHQCPPAPYYPPYNPYHR